MASKYGDCIFCGGLVEERLVPREIRWQGQLFIFEDVPMGVCTQCGEKFILPQVAQRIDAALKSLKHPRRTVNVPVYQYQADVA
ncbi:MAG: YgiT-type zinc finger protein [Anaerolineales bacterium]|nr:YgiT-type zinc finger protein [Anaerolineales bacterium]